MKRADIKELEGQTLKKIEGKEGEKVLTFITVDNKRFQMFHDQDCCESVYLEDINGDLEDLLDTPIISAECRTSEENPEGVKVDEYQEVFLWTFYRLSTIKGTVVLRWYGESNGYYGVDVNFYKE